jgi:hypothetical protein
MNAMTPHGRKTTTFWNIPTQGGQSMAAMFEVAWMMNGLLPDRHGAEIDFLRLAETYFLWRAFTRSIRSLDTRAVSDSNPVRSWSEAMPTSSLLLQTVASRRGGVILIYSGSKTL